MKRLAIIIVSLLCMVLAFGCGDPPQLAVVDGISSSAVEGYEFVVFKTGDQLWTIPQGRSVHFTAGTAEPELENGQFALIKADVEILTGGEAGYMEEPFVNSLISCDVMDYQSAVEKAEIHGTEEGFSYEHHLLTLGTDQGTAIAAICKGKVHLYLDGEFLGEYEELFENGDHTEKIKQIISRRNENE